MHELAKWGTTLVALIGFALALGLNPALYGATADVLARHQQALPRVAWMVAGLSFGAVTQGVRA